MEELTEKKEKKIGKNEPELKISYPKLSEESVEEFEEESEEEDIRNFPLSFLFERLIKE